MNKTSAYISEVPSTNIHAVIRQQFISPHSNEDLVSLAAVFWMSRNAPPKETAADIRTTFLSHCPCGLSDWTSLKRWVWREKVPKNGTRAVIGQFGERNVVRMSAAVSFGGALRDIQKTAAKETNEDSALN